MIELRDYQKDLFARAQAAFRSGKKHPLVQLCTGGGKSAILASICLGSLQKGTPTVAVAHRRELIGQLSGALAKFGVRHAVIAPTDVIAEIRAQHIAEHGWPMIDQQSPIMVASVQTLVRRFDKMKHRPKLIITDEGHHLTEGSTWAKVHEQFADAFGLILTATPIRLDGKGLGKGLGGYADDIILGPPMRWLIDNGYLSDYRIFGPPQALLLKGVKTRMGDFAKEDLATAMDKASITGDVVEHYKQLADGKLGVAFCVSVAHAEHVAAQFNASGIPAEPLHGGLDSAVRRRRLRDLEAGKIKIITAADIVSEGFDLPAIEVAMLLRPTQSLSLYLQQIGRALRPAPGKTHAIILDHAANYARHGMPDSDFGWSLEGRKKEKKAANDNEPTVRIAQCKHCYFVFEPAPTCPQCGAASEIKYRQVEHREGQLEEVTEAPAQRVATGRLQDKASLKAAGISDRRADHILAARAEKEKLQNELRDLLTRWSKSTGRGVTDGWGFAMADIRDMKPRALKEQIEKVGEALFLDPANDNREQTSLALA